MQKSVFPILLALIISLQYVQAEPPQAPAGFEWQVLPELFDEFNSSFDASKWMKYHPYWKGRDSTFDSNNVWITNQSIMILQSSLSATGIHAACLSSKTKAARPGCYYEASIKASKLSMTTAFWFQGSHTEIDVIENVGASIKNPAANKLMMMNTHYFKDGWKKDIATPAKWKMESGCDEEFHNYGVWWKDARNIALYHNNTLVTNLVPGGDFTENQYLFFDTEVFSWEGIPTPGSLQDPEKNKMQVDWVRAWQLVPLGGSLPVPPTEVNAITPPNRRTILSWKASAHAATYNIKRSANMNGPFTTIATGIKAGTYEDSTLPGIQPCYYVVSAVNSRGESSPSLAVSTSPGQQTQIAAMQNDPSRAEEFRIRGGLPNFFALLNSGKPVRIAYLGGSITAANGWRPKTTAWFKAQYPKAEIIEINAAISGTGSDYGACRIAGDVLTNNPDLVFMEHRVNGGGGFEAQSVEGIIRQIWNKNPRTDVCLVYTIAQWMLKDLQAGKPPKFGATMETMANLYNIPSIDLGIEIARREKEGTLVFKTNAPVEGKLVFSSDGVHPGNEGHDVYRDVIARSMLAMKSQATPSPHPLPAPLEPHCWEQASLIPATNAILSAGWTPIDTGSDPVYRSDFGRTHDMLRGGVKCNRTGASITVKWTGTTLGFSDIPQGNGMEVEVTIDQKPPLTIKRPQTEQLRKFARFFYLPEQAPGEHTAVLRVKNLPDGLSFYAGQVLIIGKPFQPNGNAIK